PRTRKVTRWQEFHTPDSARHDNSGRDRAWTRGRIDGFFLKRGEGEVVLRREKKPRCSSATAPGQLLPHEPPLVSPPLLGQTQDYYQGRWERRVQRTLRWRLEMGRSHEVAPRRRVGAGASRSRERSAWRFPPAKRL